MRSCAPTSLGPRQKAEYVVGGLRDSRYFARKQKNIAPLARTIKLEFGGTDLLNPAYDLDVFLRGTRDYVQGTQLIAESAKLLSHGNYSVKKAAFTSITKKAVKAAIYSSERSIDSETIGSVVFADPEGQTVTFGLVAQNSDAPQSDSPFTFELSLREETDEQCCYDFSNAEAMCDILDAVVQAIKTFIQRQSARHYDIWFTGIRNLHLPVSSDSIDSSGSITISKLKVHRNGNLHQSLFRTEVEAEKMGRLSGFVTFAHKVK
tara:strand:- start:8552 stop:9340 length:789 start_codon:yes stop_codon:yes gene_type:complete